MDASTPTDLLLKDEVFRIKSAVFTVSRTMGAGFLEAVYQECLALELTRSGVPFRAFPQLRLSYRGTQLKQTYSPDLICFEMIIVELKAVRAVAPEHRAQVLNYLRATNLEVGLLVNFGTAPRSTVERLVLQKEETANDAKGRESVVPRRRSGSDASWMVKGRVLSRPFASFRGSNYRGCAASLGPTPVRAPSAGVPRWPSAPRISGGRPGGRRVRGPR